MAATNRGRDGRAHVCVTSAASMWRVPRNMPALQNVSRDAAGRRRHHRQHQGVWCESIAAANSDAADAVGAGWSAFVETLGQTLIIKLTPLGKVPGLQLLQLLRTDPVTAARAISGRSFERDCRAHALSGRLSRM